MCMPWERKFSGRGILNLRDRFRCRADGH
jgi:hypothetical protein